MKGRKATITKRVKDINRILQDNRKDIAASKTRLFFFVTDPNIQQQCTEFIEKVREDRFNMVKNRQRGKFNSLLNKSQAIGNSLNMVQDEEGRSNNRVVHNNSQHQVRSIDNIVVNTNSRAISNNSHTQQGQNSNGNRVSRNNNNKSKWVVNLSSKPLTPLQVSLLEKGPNFALTHINPPNIVLIAAVELACQNLSEQDAQELRTKVNILL